MRRKKLNPDRLDRIVADGIAKYGNRREERVARWLTLAGDERFLLPAAAALALLGEATQSRHRRDFEYLLALLVVTSALDHVSKHLLTETRPDRLYPRFLKFGIPKSGAAGDAFPSGHALHLGATASALSRIYPHASKCIWGMAGAMTATRVALLAHWLSDAAFGFIGGIVLDKSLSRLTRYAGHKRPRANDQPRRR